MTKRISTTRLWAAALTAGTLLFGTAACGTAGSGVTGGGGPPQSGGIAEYGVYSEMRGFDPVQLSLVGTGIERAAAVMDTLLYRDEITDEVKPKLAQSIATTDNGTTWVLGLREGVTFTDGEPLDADAVIFNINRHIAPDSTSSAKAALANMQSAEATGEYEVTFTLASPDAFFPYTLTAQSPASLVGSPKALADPGAFSVNPVGAGPFKLATWVRDDRLELVRNDTYWNEGKPYLDGVTFTVQGNFQTRADALITGQSDVTLLTGDLLNRVEGDNQFVVWTELPAGGGALTPNGSKGPGADLRVRQAINKAFDPAVTQQLIFPGSSAWDGSLDCVPFPTGSAACEPDAAAVYDPEGAKKLIADYVADGGTTRMELVHLQANQNGATYIQQQLKEIGLDVTLRSADAAGLSEATANGAYDLMFSETAGSGYPSVWNRFYSGSPTNWPRQANPEVDALLLSIRQEVDPAAAAEKWREFSMLLHDEAITTWIAAYSARIVSSAGLHLGSEEQPYQGSAMIYFDSAWLEN